VTEHSYHRYLRIAEACHQIAQSHPPTSDARYVWFDLKCAACRLAARGEWTRV
jgi:hypothetical protein